ncbi:PLDc N-terminal domain-containing protein [Pseudoalteromonas sp.]|uniref:PLDc N-terminal domain-containing protein n=1 Tax=Pseudoalteromonas sp. TaxID=53249 RepID=UPI003566DD3F
MNEIIYLIIILSAYILPVVSILNSKRTQGHEKNAWLIAVIVFSWLGLFIYFIVVPKQGHKKTPATRRKQ